MTMPWLCSLTILTDMVLKDNFPECMTMMIVELPQLVHVNIPFVVLVGIEMSWIATLHTLSVDYRNGGPYSNWNNNPFNPSVMAIINFLKSITEYMSTATRRCNLRKVTFCLLWKALKHPSFTHMPSPVDRWGNSGACVTLLFNEQGVLVNYTTGSTVSQIHTVCNSIG
jgi:hypothetical protein